MITCRTSPSLALALLIGLVGLPAGIQAQTQNQMGGMEAHAHAKGEPSTMLTVTGTEGKVLTFSAADLKGMPHRNVIVFNEHAKTNETYAGVALADLLARAEVPLGKDLKGKAFLMYVIAEGTDHYRVLYSLDEVDGVNHAGDVIVADSLNGAPLTTDGAFKLVSTEDKRPARWVRNLSAITVKSAE